MDHAGFDHVSRPFGIGLHVRGGCVRRERFRARPFLDHDKGARPKLGLRGAEYWEIDNRNVFDATLFGMHRWDIRPAARAFPFHEEARRLRLAVQRGSWKMVSGINGRSAA